MTKRKEAEPYARFYRVAPKLVPIPTSAPAISPGQSKKFTSNFRLKMPRFTLANASVALAIIMSILLGYMAYRYHLATNLIESKPASALSFGKKTNDGDTSLKDLSETEPSTSAHVAADRPARLSIDKIDVDASIIGLGISSEGQMSVPGNIWQVGWYKGSAKPKDKGGAIVLNGHVHGPTKPGVFYKLNKLKSGDIIKLGTGDGKIYQYRVVRLATYSAGDIGGDLYQSVSSAQGLNLVTCTGKWDSQGEYSQRLVVFSEKI